MNAKLTTMTCYWGRPEALDVWIAAMRHVSCKDVEHVLFIVGERMPVIPDMPKSIRVVEYPGKAPFSIGHCHNMGARIANTEWIMKLDLDAIPALGFFRELLVLLEEAGPRDWFNVGMIYMKPIFNATLLSVPSMPIGSSMHRLICGNLRTYSAKGYHYPSATNFVCRRDDYVDLGGCDAAFDGYGWEDYQQIYMLERYQQGKDPLPGMLNESNITQRCRDEISRPKALELFRRNPIFALLHRWHPAPEKIGHKLAKNKRTLLNYVSNMRD